MIRPLSFAICPSLPFTSVPPQTLGGRAPDFLSEQIQETCTRVEDVHGDKTGKNVSKGFRPERSTNLFININFFTVNTLSKDKSKPRIREILKVTQTGITLKTILINIYFLF